jgi:hypothetical protein
MKAIALAALMLVTSVGCTTRSESGTSNSLVNATPGSTTAQSSPPQNVQQLRVAIEDGKFKDRVYSAQVGAAVLNITSDEGPYTLRVDEIIDAFPVPASQPTRVETNLPMPGDFTMRLAETGSFAVLNVREIGGR